MPMNDASSFPAPGPEPMEPTENRAPFGALVSQTARRWRRAVDRRLQPFGLTEATWLPLLRVARAPAQANQSRILIVPFTLGDDGRLAKHQLEQDAGGGLDKQAAFAEFGQIHSGIGDAEGVELTAMAVVVLQTEADMVDRLAATVDRGAAARDEMHDRLTVRIESVAREREIRAIAGLQIQDLL